MKKTRKIINILTIVIIVLAIQFLIVAHTYADYGDVVYEFSTPVPEPTGLTWDGQNFWTCGNNGLIYKFANDGTILHTIAMPDTGHIENYHPDVAWDGEHLWFANYSDYNGERAVFQLDPQDGSILQEFRNEWIEKAGDDGFGLEYSGSTLYLGLDQGSGYNRLIIIDSLNGEFVKETPLPGWPRGGLALTKDSPPRELWVGSQGGLSSSYIAKIKPGTGYIHSLFLIDNLISGLAWNGFNLVSIDGDGIVKMYDITSPCNPNIITIEPWGDDFCQTQNPTFTWTSECSDSFIIDFSPNDDFSALVASFPVGNITRVTMPDVIRDRFPYDVNIYMRIKGFVDGVYSKQSDVRVIKKYFDPWCW